MSNSLLKYASITQKISMSILGLFLAVFLLVHLTINLMLLLPDQGEAFRAAAEFMGTNPFIMVFEYVLFAAFFVHILLGIILWFQNNQARPVAYAKANVSETSFFSKYMIHTGIILLIFLILHFVHFYFAKIGLVTPGATYMFEGHEHPDFYTMAIALLKQPMYAVIYIISFLALGFHLNHAIQSGFQSLGLEHSKYTPFVKKMSTVYALIIAVGFSIIPIYFLLG